MIDYFVSLSLSSSLSLPFSKSNVDLTTELYTKFGGKKTLHKRRLPRMLIHFSNIFLEKDILLLTSMLFVISESV